MRPETNMKARPAARPIASEMVNLCLLHHSSPLVIGQPATVGAINRHSPIAAVASSPAAFACQCLQRLQVRSRCPCSGSLSLQSFNIVFTRSWWRQASGKVVGSIGVLFVSGCRTELEAWLNISALLVKYPVHARLLPPWANLQVPMICFPEKLLSFATVSRSCKRLNVYSLRIKTDCCMSVNRVQRRNRRQRPPCSRSARPALRMSCSASLQRGGLILRRLTGIMSMATRGPCLHPDPGDKSAAPLSSSLANMTRSGRPWAQIGSSDRLGTLFDDELGSRRV